MSWIFETIQIGALDKNSVKVSTICLWTVFFCFVFLYSNVIICFFIANSQVWIWYTVSLSLSAHRSWLMPKICLKMPITQFWWIFSLICRHKKVIYIHIYSKNEFDEIDLNRTTGQFPILIELLVNFWHCNK